MTATIPARPEVAPAKPWSFPAASELRLANGFTVVAHHMPGKHVLAMRLLLDLQLRAEPDGLEGLATLAAQSLDEGTENYDSQAFAVARDRVGASYSVNVDGTGATLSLDVPSTRVTAGIELLAEAALRPTFPVSEVDRLIQQRLNAIASERANPDGRANIEMLAAWYAGSRRALPHGGTAESVGRLDRDVIAAFYADNVDPATSILVLVGDLTGIDIEALATRSFGSWTSRGRTRTAPLTGDVAAGPKVVLVDRPGAVQTNLLLALPGAARNNPDYPALQAVVQALAGGMDSRINNELREDKGYTYGFRGQAIPDLADGRLLFSGAVQTEVTEPAVKGLLEIFEIFAADGANDAEVAVAIDGLAGRAPLQYERPQSVAQVAAMVAASGLPADYIDANLTALRSLDADAVNAGYTRSTSLKEAVLVAVGDGSVIRKGLENARLGELTVIPA